MSKKPYTRKVSATEARDGRIMIVGRQLKMFPRAGKPFTVRSADEEHEKTIVAEHCTCRGPQNPHEHYYIEWEGLTPGDSVRIDPDPEAEDVYTLTVEER